MKVKANAKVNLSLDITGRRDDGYHMICSVMQSVSLCDIIELTLSDGISVVCDRNELSGSDNLCFKAAEKFYEASDIHGGVAVTIEKHIPVAGGLGGGSADAAAVLVALNKMYGEPLDKDRLCKLALTLGADVPFCLSGGTVLAEGIGESLTGLPSLPDCIIVIAKKGIKSSTKDMYARIDCTEPIKTSDVDRIVFGLLSGNSEYAVKGFYNRFEEVAEQNILIECKSVMASFGCLYSGLSGAGPSVVGIFRSQDLRSAESAAEKLKLNGYEAYLCRPAVCGVEIIE